MNNLTCPNCNTQFITARPDKRYCTKNCKEQAKAKRRATRRKAPQTFCEHCNGPKGSAKGKYCSKPECYRMNYWEERGGIDAYKKAEQRRQDFASKPKLGKQQGPKQLCRNCGTVLARLSSHYCNTKKCQLASKAEYRRLNREKIRSSRTEQKMKRRKAYKTHVDIKRIFERDHWTCQLCGGSVNKEAKYPSPMSASLDHIIPISKGGTHMEANVQLAHLRCNIQKGARGGGEQLALI